MAGITQAQREAMNKLFTELLADLPFFNQIESNDQVILHYGVYHPYRNGTNDKFDKFSKNILGLKECNMQSILYFNRLFNGYFRSYFTIVTIPSHDPSKPISGIQILASMICNSGVSIINGTNCLIRTKKISKLSKGGSRDIDVHLSTLALQNQELIKDKRVLLFDDVTTTGNSLFAGQQLLLNAGALKVQCFAIAQTK